jgi:hypothetical protein
LAFALTDEWQVAPPPSRTFLPPWLTRLTRRSVAAGTSLCIVAVLIVAVLVSQRSDRAAERASSQIALFDVGDRTPSSEASGRAPDRMKRAPGASGLAPINPPTEWSVALVPAAPSAQTASPNLGAGSGTGEAAYDPYAGAAPRRRERTGQDTPSPATPCAGDDVSLSPDSLAELRTRFRRAYPDSRGAVMLRVSVDANGKVVAAMVIRTTMPPANAQALSFMTVGLSTTPLSPSPRFVTLPEMVF